MSSCYCLQDKLYISKASPSKRWLSHFTPKSIVMHICCVNAHTKDINLICMGIEGIRSYWCIAIKSPTHDATSYSTFSAIPGFHQYTYQHACLNPQWHNLLRHSLMSSWGSSNLVCSDEMWIWEHWFMLRMVETGWYDDLDMIAQWFWRNNMDNFKMFIEMENWRCIL